MAFKCSMSTSNEERMHNAGVPRFIRCKPFVAEEYMKTFDILGRQVKGEEQVNYLTSCLEEDGGWVAMVCGHPEQVRLFGYSLMNHYAKSSSAIEWVHVSGSQFNKFTDTNKPYSHRDMLVLDSLLTHPAMHPDASRGYDPKRIGKIFDIVATTRGQTSVIVLCPGIDPATAYSISQIQFDMAFNLQYKPKYLEL